MSMIQGQIIDENVWKYFIPNFAIVMYEAYTKIREKRDEMKEEIDDILMKSFLKSTLLRTYVSWKECMVMLKQWGGHIRFDYFSRDNSIIASFQ